MKIRVNSLINFINETKKLQDLFSEANQKLQSISEELKVDNSGDAIEAIYNNINKQIVNNDKNKEELEKFIDFYDRYIKDLQLLNIVENEDGYFEMKDIDYKIIETNNSISEIQALLYEYGSFEFYQLYGQDVYDYQRRYFNIIKKELETEVEFNIRKDLYYNEYKQAQEIDNEINTIKNKDIPRLEEVLSDLYFNLTGFNQLKDLEEQDANFANLFTKGNNPIMDVNIGSLKKNKQDFIDMLTKKYGFDIENSKLIYKIKNNIDTDPRFSDMKQKEKDWMFNRIMSEMVYGRDHDIFEGSITTSELLWDIMAGNLRPHFKKYGFEFEDIDILTSLGLSAAEAKRVQWSIIIQNQINSLQRIPFDINDELIKDKKGDVEDELYEKHIILYADTYGLDIGTMTEEEKKIFAIKINNMIGKSDFAHESVINSMYLHTDNEFYYNIGGWYGDVSDYGGRAPSINNGDYLADLDARNIKYYMEEYGDSFHIAKDNYLKDMASNKINRAELFLKAEGSYSEVEKKVLEGLDLSTIEEAKLKYPSINNFLMSLKNSDETLVDYN